MPKRAYLAAALLLLAVGCRSLGGPNPSVTAIGPFRSADAAQHQAWIQKRLDEGAQAPRVFHFAPGEYVLTDPAGLRVPNGATLLLHGARFTLANTIAADGQAFLLKDVSNVTFLGGEIVGQRNAWPPSVNVAGIRAYGGGSNLRIQDLVCRDLSSNAVGVFGTSDEAPFRNVSLGRVVSVNCCNVYTDYLQPNKGPAPGSDREDQGTVALYNVDGWSVDACRFEDSQSDGTHFFHAHNGAFTGSTVSGSKMGGYFLEGCENVVATGNIFRANGSRGVTVERDSRFCTLTGNVVTLSGREGLWMPDVCAVIVSGNVFKQNGRKDDGEKDCEIRIDETPEYATKAEDLRIVGNIFETDAEQTAAIFVGKGVGTVVEESNTFRGRASQRVSVLDAP